MANYNDFDSLPPWKDINTMNKVELKSGVTTVGDCAFMMCTLSSVTIPESVTRIGNNAFAGNYLYDLTIPEGVTEIGYQAFFMTSMKNVTIPSSVKTVGMRAFGSCGSLTEVTFNGRETTVYGSAFSNCSKLKTIHVPHGAVEHYRSQDGISSGITIVTPTDHTITLTAEANGNTVTVTGTCKNCGYNAELGSVAFSFENLTYADPEAKVSYKKVDSNELKVKMQVTGIDSMVSSEQEDSLSLVKGSGDWLKAGDHTLNVSFSIGDSSSNECGLSFNTAPAELTNVTLLAESREYEPGNRTVQVLSAGGKSSSEDAVSVEFPEGTTATISGEDAGTYDTVTLTEDVTDIYGGYIVPADTYPVYADRTTPGVEIKKVTYTGTTTANARAKYGATGTYDLTALLPEGGTAGTPSIGEDTNGIFAADSLAVNGNTLSYRLNENAQLNGTGTITVPVKFKNYNDFNLTIIVTVVDKEVPTLSISPVTVTYTGNPVPDSVIHGTATVDGKTVDGTWSFDGTAPVSVADSGPKTVTFTPKDASCESATGTVQVTINKATPTGAPKYTAISASGKTLADAGLTAEGGTFSTTGTVDWVLPDTTQVTANTAYEWTFTPADTANYNTATGKLTLWSYTPPVNPGGNEPSNPGGGSEPSDPGGGSVPSDPGSTGGSDSTGSSSVTVPVTGDQNTVHVSAGVSGSTATVSKIDTSQIDHVVGEDGQTGMVEIDFTGLDSSIDTVKLPTAAIRDIAEKAENEEVGGLTVKLPGGEVAFDAGALSAIQDQAGSQITLAVVPAKPADLNSRQKEAVGSAPVFDLTLRSSSGAITDFRGGYATVSLPYALPAGQDPTGVVVYYLDSTGNITPCSTMYDVRSKSVIFTTGHFSLYFVGYDPAAVWENPYTDVAEDAQYYEAVRYVSVNGLMGGYGDGTFGPDNTLSRAQFAQILWNRAGRPVVNYLMQYSDVSQGAWYAEPIRWATSEGIVGGYGDGRFGPDDPVTWEQLAVMLWRHAGSPAPKQERSADGISAYALEAVLWAEENDILRVSNGSAKTPVTRAETAQTLQSFLETWEPNP